MPKLIWISLSTIPREYVKRSAIFVALHTRGTLRTATYDGKLCAGKSDPLIT